MRCILVFILSSLFLPPRPQDVQLRPPYRGTCGNFYVRFCSEHLPSHTPSFEDVRLPHWHRESLVRSRNRI